MRSHHSIVYAIERCPACTRPWSAGARGRGRAPWPSPPRNICYIYIYIYICIYVYTYMYIYSEGPSPICINKQGDIEILTNLVLT